jgi:hypothetical protein
MIPRSHPSILLCFIRLSMSPYAHVFAVRNRYASQVFCACLNVEVLFGCVPRIGTYS